MRSPFPGMDPYLETPTLWSDFHASFIRHSCSGDSSYLHPEGSSPPVTPCPARVALARLTNPRPNRKQPWKWLGIRPVEQVHDGPAE